jgi:hypothetical protein
VVERAGGSVAERHRGDAREEAPAASGSDADQRQAQRQQGELEANERKGPGDQPRDDAR